MVFNTLGRAPRQGERVSLPGFEITVVGVSGSRITRVRIARGDEARRRGGRGNVKAEDLSDVRYEVDRGLAWITIDRAERMNASAREPSTS